MPIKPELRGFYPLDWRELSRSIRFRRAGGCCERCGRPHGKLICVLDEGTWFDTARGAWRDERGKRARTNLPTPEALPDGIRHRWTLVRLACAHLNHDIADNSPANLAALCQRCHLIHDRPHHLARRRITYLMRRAMGDLFDGRYR